MRFTTTRKTLTVSTGIITLLASVTYAAHTISVNQIKQVPAPQIGEPSSLENVTTQQKHIEILLNDMQLYLYEGTTTIARIPIVSIGKPGSFYETIGGSYKSDYKTELHLSTIGNVYMPYGVHIFGNYFIHGIPYYENGERVSTTYSGGCIRLEDNDAKKVYDFVEEGTPIIITKNNTKEFEPTPNASTTLTSYKLTNIMVGIINLESLNQNSILGGSGVEYAKAGELLDKLLTNGDSRISEVYAKAYDNEKFLEQMNKKAEAIGLSNTRFLSVTEPVATTYDDYTRFMEYIANYKSYILSRLNRTNN